jgi:hypothetical protein
MNGCATRGHVDLLVPLEEGGGTLEIDDLANGELQTVKRLVHGIKDT